MFLLPLRILSKNRSWPRRTFASGNCAVRVKIGVAHRLDARGEIPRVCALKRQRRQ